MKQAKPVLSLVEVHLSGSAEDSLFQEIFYSKKSKDIVHGNQFTIRLAYNRYMII
jgi:hypothetical protein